MEKNMHSFPIIPPTIHICWIPLDDLFKAQIWIITKSDTFFCENYHYYPSHCVDHYLIWPNKLDHDNLIVMIMINSLNPCLNFICLMQSNPSPTRLSQHWQTHPTSPNHEQPWETMRIVVRVEPKGVELLEVYLKFMKKIEKVGLFPFFKIQWE